MVISRRDFLKIAAISALASSAVLKNPYIPRALAEKLEREGKRRWVPTACIICGQGCPIKIEVVEWNGKVYLNQIVHNYVEGFEDYFAACGRPRALFDVWDHPDRIRRPLIRVGERGSGEFREVTWEEALDYVAENLKKYLDHPEQIVVFSHQGCEKGLIKWFANLLGTPNVTKHADTCHTSADAGRWFVFGKLIGPGGIYPDYEHAQFVVLMGRNPYGGFVATPWAQVFSKGIANGMRVVVFDIRFSDVCSVAEKCYIVKPGTDLAVSLAIASYILQKRLYNREFLIKYTNAPMLLYRNTLEPVETREIGEGPRKGKLDYLVYDEATGEYKFKSEAQKPSLEHKGTYNGREVVTVLELLREELSKYTPEWASKISGVPAHEIVWVAEQLAEFAPRAFIDHGYKTVRWYNEPMWHRVNAIVNALLGSIGTRGGWAWPKKVKPPTLIKAKPRKVESIISYWKKNGYPLASSSAYSMLAIRSILEEKPYPIKAAIISLENVASHIPNGGKKLVEALKKLEFVVVIDTMWSEVCKYADVILPIPFFFEYDNASLYGASKGNIGQVSVMMKAIDPPPGVDVKPPREIIYELTRRIFGEEKAKEISFILDPREVWRRQCEKLGISFDELLKRGTVAKYTSPDYSPLTRKGVLPTKTGEIELINVAALETFREHLGRESNLNPLPVFVRPLWMRKGQLAEDEFIPVDYMHKLTAINTWARNTKLLLELVKAEEEDRVLIHKDRAARLGIRDGDEVIVENPETGSSLRVRVKTTTLIAPEVIAGVHGLTPGPHEGGKVRFTYMPKYGLNTNYLAPFTILEGIGSAALFDFRVRVRKAS